MSLRLRIMAGSFVLLLAAAVVLERPWEGDAYARTAAAVRRLFPGLRAQLPEVARVEVASRGISTTLVREEGEWRVAERFGHPADPARVIGLLEALAVLTNRNRISDNPVMRARYAVEEGDGTRIRLFDVRGTLLADLVSGGLKRQEIAAGGRARLEFYVRPAGSDEVVLAGFRPPVVDPADWLEPGVLPRGTVPGQVAWIERLGPGGAVLWRIRRVQDSGRGSRWRLEAPAPAEADAALCERLTVALAGMRATDVAGLAGSGAATMKAYGFDGSGFRAGVAGASFTLHFGSLAPEGGRFLHRSGLPWVYRVPEYAPQQLRRDVSELRSGS